MSGILSMQRDINDFLRHAGHDRLTEDQLTGLLAEAAGVPSPSSSQQQRAIKQLSLAAPKPSLLYSKYDELRSRQTVPHLDQVLILLARRRKADSSDVRHRSTGSVSASASAAADDQQSTAGSSRVSGAADRSSQHQPSRHARRSSSGKSTAPASRIAPELKQALCDATDAPVQSFFERLMSANELESTDMVMPEWIGRRPYMSRAHVKHTAAPVKSTLAPLGNLPWSTQEYTVIEELLSCLLGVSGDYLYITDENINMDESLHPALKESVRQLCPLVQDYIRVCRFCEDSSFMPSQVVQALGASIRIVLQEHKVLVAQLETQLRKRELTVHSLWFYLQPSSRTMHLLASIVDNIYQESLNSGQTLTLLGDEEMCVGDERTRKLCSLLLHDASVPYLRMLDTWVCQGVVRDPYCEFLVGDNGAPRGRRERCGDRGYDDDYWEKRYSLAEHKAPGFLKAEADVILRAGKYLNVIKHSKGSIDVSVSEGLAHSAGNKRYIQAIRRSYEYASNTLLRQLMDRNELIAHLRSVKHYYMLDKGDFIIQLISLCESELNKSIDDILPTRLQNLLELALRTSTATSDQYKDDLRPELLGYDLTTQMMRIHSIETSDEHKWLPAERLTISGLEAFTFDSAVAWPVSLVINRKSIACYQMIFRLLFQCKLLETQLCRLWVSCACVPSSVPVCCRLPANTLCQRMLVMMQNLLYYMSSEVLEPTWSNFVNNMQQVTNFDDVLQLHAALLNECMRDCMLKHLELLTVVSSLMAVCRKFLDFMQSSWGAASDGVRMSAGLVDLERRFTDALLDLMERVSEHHRHNFGDRLVGLLFRLDFNGFYMRQLEARVKHQLESADSAPHPDVNAVVAA